jgi:hypothetical protein
MVRIDDRGDESYNGLLYSFSNLFVCCTVDGTEAGCSIEQVIQMMSTHPQAEIRQAVEALSEEGHVYSTITENHFKIAE